jgi:hypothetical protein
LHAVTFREADEAGALVIEPRRRRKPMRLTYQSRRLLLNPRYVDGQERYADGPRVA